MTERGEDVWEALGVVALVEGTYDGVCSVDGFEVDLWAEADLGGAKASIDLEDLCIGQPGCYRVNPWVKRNTIVY